MGVKRFSHTRLDRGLKVDSNGFLRAKAHATRAGIFNYRGPNGETVKELRHPDDVFNADSMNSLAYVPVTNNHPSEGSVNPLNAQKLQVGQTGKPEQVDQFISLEVVVTRDDAIQAVQAGRQELSCGYTCDLDWTAGMWNGEQYDAIQKNIRYNHLAIVDRGRAGPHVRLKLDAGDAEEVEALDDEDQKPNKEAPKMKVKIGDKEFEIEDAAGKAMNDELAKKDGEIESLKKTKEAEVSKAKADADTAQAKADVLTEQLKTKTDAAPAEDVIKARVASRIAVLEAAGKVTLPETVKLDSLSDIEIKKEILKVRSPSLKLDGKSDEYVGAAFDMAVTEIEQVQETHNRFKVVSTKVDSEKGANGEEIPDADEARKKMILDNEKAWQKPAQK